MKKRNCQICGTINCTWVIDDGAFSNDSRKFTICDDCHNKKEEEYNHEDDFEGSFFDYIKMIIIEKEKSDSIKFTVENPYDLEKQSQEIISKRQESKLALSLENADEEITDMINFLMQKYQKMSNANKRLHDRIQNDEIINELHQRLEEKNTKIKELEAKLNAVKELVK